MAQGVFDLLAFENGLFDALFECLVKFSDRFFGFFSGCYIDRGADQTDHFAVGIEQRRFGREPYRCGAVSQVDLFFDLFADIALHDPQVGFHKNPRLFLVIQKLQIRLADEKLGRLADQVGGAAIGDQHPSLEILGVDNARNGSREYPQQFVKPVALVFGSATAVYIEQYARTANRLATTITLDSSTGFDPAINTVFMENPVFASIGFAALQRVLD